MREQETTGTRILVIDDEAAIRRFLHSALSSEEFDLYEADSGHTGLAATASFRPDLVLWTWGSPTSMASR